VMLVLLISSPDKHSIHCSGLVLLPPPTSPLINDKSQSPILLSPKHLFFLIVLVRSYKDNIHSFTVLLVSVYTEYSVVNNCLQIPVLVVAYTVLFTARGHLDQLAQLDLHYRCFTIIYLLSFVNRCCTKRFRQMRSAYVY